MACSTERRSFTNRHTTVTCPVQAACGTMAGMAKQKDYNSKLLDFREAIHKALVVDGVPVTDLGAAFASMISAHGGLLAFPELRHKYGRIAEPDGKGGARMVVPKVRAAKAGK
jgi:hypothetical protein